MTADRLLFAAALLLAAPAGIHDVTAYLVTLK